MKLESINFPWRLEPHNEYDRAQENERLVDNGKPSQTETSKRTWDEKFRALVAYSDKHGDCSVPWNYNGDQSLGSWIYYQRYRKGHLTEEQKEQLDDLGFDWKTKGEKSLPQGHDSWHTQ